MVIANVSKALKILRERGLSVSLISPDRVVVQEQEAAIEIEPSKLDSDSISYEMAVYVLERITPALRRRARERKFSVLVGTSTGEVWLFGSQLSPPDAQVRQKQPASSQDFTRFGLMRSLALTSRPRTLGEFSQELGVTQDEVSNALDCISDLVVQTNEGWSAKSFDLVADEFLENYPGPGGHEGYWFSEMPVVPQAREILEASPGSVLSADSAADELAPHRMAATAMVYSEERIDFEALGLTRTGRGTATLVEVVPFDKTIFPLARSAGKLPLVDGLLVTYDLRRSAGPDRGEASFVLLDALWKQWNNSRR